MAVQMVDVEMKYFPGGYSYLLFLYVLSYIQNFLFTGRVSRTRLECNVIFPAAYAPLGHEHETKVNSTIRAHGNHNEQWMPSFHLFLFLGLYEPMFASLLALIWIVARFAYFYGYIHSIKGRIPGFIVSMICVFTAIGRLLYIICSALAS